MSKPRKDNEFDIRVGNNLKYYREQKGIEQKELARLLSVTPTAVCNWESGNRALYFATAKQICKLLDCTLEDLSK